VRFARHAKNEMRWKGWAQREVRWVIANLVKVDADAYGHPRYFGYIRGDLVRVVVAADDPEFVITIHPRRHF
jgi:hypothetical protein